MDVYDRILEKYEYDYKKIEGLERKIFNEFFDNCNFELKMKLKYLYYLYIKKYSTFAIIKYKFSDYFSYYIRTLEAFGYNVEKEIRDTISSLGLLNNPNNNSTMIKVLLNYPDIKDISFDGNDTFNICSDKFGEISFQLALGYFKNNKDMINYIKNTSLPKKCHSHTYYMSKILPDNYSITSLIDGSFDGTKYYHSYGYNESENVVIDLNANAIIDNDIYNMIYKPDIIVNLPNKEVESVLNEVNKITNQRKEKLEMLKIALYIQSLEEENKILIKK